MSSVAAVLAIISLGVNYSWQPVAEGSDEYEYIVEVEPELVEALQRGEPLAIESNVPAEVDSIRRVRVVIGSEIQAATPSAGPAVEHTVRRQFSDGWQSVPPAAVDRYSTPASPPPGGVPGIGVRTAQNSAAPGTVNNSGSNVIDSLDSGLSRVGNQLQQGGQQVLSAGDQFGRNLQDALRAPSTSTPQSGNTGPGPLRTLGTVAGDLVRDTSEQIESAGRTIRGVVNGDAPLLGNSGTTGGYTPNTNPSGTTPPGSYQSYTYQSGTTTAAGTNQGGTQFGNAGQTPGQVGSSFVGGANAGPNYQPQPMPGGGTAQTAGAPGTTSGAFSSSPAPGLPLSGMQQPGAAGMQVSQGNNAFTGSGLQNPAANSSPQYASGGPGIGSGTAAGGNLLDNIPFRGPYIAPNENSYRVADSAPPSTGLQGTGALPGTAGGFPSGGSNSAASSTSSGMGTGSTSGGPDFNWPNDTAVSAPPLGNNSYDQGGFAGGGLETVNQRPVGTGFDAPPRDNQNDMGRGTGGSLTSGPPFGQGSLQTSPDRRDLWPEREPSISRGGQEELDRTVGLPPAFPDPASEMGAPPTTQGPSQLDTPQPRRQRLMETLAISIALVGSLGGNLFLGWSYMDARSKYLSALRKRVRGYSGRDDRED